jgi:hypothetical protein
MVKLAMAAQLLLTLMGVLLSQPPGTAAAAAAAAAATSLDIDWRAYVSRADMVWHSPLRTRGNAELA